VCICCQVLRPEPSQNEHFGKLSMTGLESPPTCMHSNQYSTAFELVISRVRGRIPRPSSCARVYAFRGYLAANWSRATKRSFGKLLITPTVSLAKMRVLDGADSREDVGPRVERTRAGPTPGKRCARLRVPKFAATDAGRGRCLYTHMKYRNNL
jgi:hypothetical protein